MSARLVYDTIKEERKRVRFQEVMDFNFDGLVNYKDYIIYYYNNFLYEIGWEVHKRKYLTLFLCLFWIAIGVLYGIYMEGMEWHGAVYFAVGMMSCSGLPAPLCEGASPYNCHIRSDLAIFMIVYIIVGVPLYTFTLGQFSGLIIQQAVHFTEARVLTRPLKDHEFKNAIKLCKRNNNLIENANSNIDEDRGRDYNTTDQTDNLNRISLAEFLVLELIRLKRVDEEDITEICDLFCEIDEDNRGYLDVSILQGKSESHRHSTSNTKETYQNQPTFGGNYGALGQTSELILDKLKSNDTESMPLLPSESSKSSKSSLGLLNRIIIAKRLLRKSGGNSKTSESSGSSKFRNIAARVIAGRKSGLTKNNENNGNNENIEISSNA